MYKLEKINELIKQELGKIIFEEEELEPGVLATLMAAETTEDLKEATITFSVFPTDQGPKVLKRFQAHIYNIQQKLNKKIKTHPVPKIRFVLDTTEAEGQKIETLLQKLK